jgi:hypothetical protein
MFAFPEKSFSKLYGLYAVGYVLVAISMLFRYSVSITDKDILIRSGFFKRRSIAKKDVKGVHVQGHRTILVLDEEKNITIRHEQLRTSNELIALLQDMFPAAIPPANVLGTYTIEKKNPA